jgi:hypothetical protein
MERYCGVLQPAIRSRRFPFASLDRHVVEDAQLTQIKAVFDKADELSLKPLTPRGLPQGAYEDPMCKLCSIDISQILIILI